MTKGIMYKVGTEVGGELVFYHRTFTNLDNALNRLEEFNRKHSKTYYDIYAMTGEWKRITEHYKNW